MRSAPTILISFGSLASITALVLLRKAKPAVSRGVRGISSSLSYCVPAPVRKALTESRPWVRVPVLSVNRIFRLPAVSMPSSLRTSTLTLSSFFMLIASTMAIIIGKPSGTATTTTMIAKIAAVTKSLTITPLACAQ